MPIAMMIDIETLGTTPDAVVVQIGVVVGNTETGAVLRKVGWCISTDEQRDRRMDYDTLCWWMLQADDVRQRVFDMKHAITPTRACAEIDALLSEFQPEEIWAGPAMFDLPILTHLFGRKPWAFWKERCLLTLRKHVDPDRKLQPPDNILAHDAVADAAWQFDYLCALRAAGR